MSQEKKNDVLVNLVKKAVGLPTGNSSCCGAASVAVVQPEPAQPAPREEKAASSCCGSAAQTVSSALGEAAPSAESNDEGDESGGCCG